MWWYEHEGQSLGPVADETIKELLQRRELSGSTLVWRDGYAGWVRVEDVEALAGFVSRPAPVVAPPPLPSAKIIAVQSDSEGGSHTGVSVGRYHDKPAWYRYFARQIDLVFIGLPTTVLAFALIGVFGSPSLQFRAQQPEIAGLLSFGVLILVWPIMNASVATIFRSTPGKALFGLSVRSVDGSRVSFARFVRREYRVMTFGLGLFIPIVTLFTCISQFNKIKNNGVAGYDNGQFDVLDTPIGGLRKFAAVSVWLLSFGLLAALNAYDRMETNNARVEQAWMNPSTRIQTMLPRGWSAEASSNKQGQTVFVFTNAAAATQVVFASEEIPENASLGAYVKAFVSGVKEAMRVDERGIVAVVSGHDAQVHQGELLSPRAPIEITFVKKDAIVWRTVIVTHREPSLSTTADIRAALFRTVRTAQR